MIFGFFTLGKFHEQLGLSQTKGSEFQMHWIPTTMVLDCEKQKQKQKLRLLPIKSFPL